MRGTPGEANYRNAQLSFRITAFGKNSFDFPGVNFSVESPTGAKLLERRVAPLGGGQLAPGQPVERTISLDPGIDADWPNAYGKTENANFNWSINGKSSGTIEKPVHKPWP
jgi:hypothetical protein